MYNSTTNGRIISRTKSWPQIFARPKKGSNMMAPT